MITHYYWPTPNGHKTAVMLEECRLEHDTRPVNILKGEQHTDAFRSISPNHRIPAIIDSDGPAGEPVTVFESGAILIYLAEKTGQFYPADPVARLEVSQWLMFQMANVGPMFGQNGYFQGYCPEDVPLARERYHNMTRQLYGVLDRRLAQSEYLGGDAYSIADIATFPWTTPVQRQLHRIDIHPYPHVARWHQQIAQRPAVQRGLALLSDVMKIGDPTTETYDSMFGERQYRDA